MTSFMGDLAIPSTHSLAWDHRFHNLGDMSLVMDDAYSAPFFSSSSSSPLGSSDLSTGYLEDVLVEFGSKRRRLMLCNDDELTNDHLTESYWNSNCTWGLPDDFISSFNNGDELGSMSSGSEEANVEISGFDRYKDSAESDKSEKEVMETKAEEEIKKRKTRVVYPFAVVKPGGVEGDVTLSDINKKIMMRPTRPVRHPVGDFACRPRLSQEAPGFSGKAVVALTRIQTRGKGTITIIRTKG